jgi:hypothetical protein
MVDWSRGYGATTLSQLGLYDTGPLCNAFSSARHLQRRYTLSDMRDLRQWRTELGEKWPVNLACDFNFHVNRRVLLHAAKICDMGQTALLLRRKACCGFFRPKNPTALAGFFFYHSWPFWQFWPFFNCTSDEHGTDYCTSPSEGRHAVNFPSRKNPTASVGSEPGSWVPKASMQIPRPPKSLTHTRRHTELTKKNGQTGWETCLCKSSIFRVFYTVKLHS